MPSRPTTAPSSTTPHSTTPPAPVPARRSFGRSPRYGKPLTERVQVLFTEDQVPELAALAAASGTNDISTWLREIALGEQLHPNTPHPADAGTDSTRVRFLAKAPCGDWREAVDLAGNFTLSLDVANALEANPGDVVVQADGDSMEGARIYDGDLVLMRPLADGRRPARGEITLVQVIRKDGSCDAMIKRWQKSDPLQLLDGEGKAVPIPKDTKEVRPVAVARGLIARL